MFGRFPTRAKATMARRTAPPIQKFGLRLSRRQTSWVRVMDLFRRTPVSSSVRGSSSSETSVGGEESIDMGHTLTLGSSAAYSTSERVESKMMMTTENRTYPPTALMSEVSTDWIPSWPTPDQENTMPRRAEPATSVPKL